MLVVSDPSADLICSSSAVQSCQHAPPAYAAAAPAARFAAMIAVGGA